MPGLFDKIKAKKSEWDTKHEEGKVDQIQKIVEDNFEHFKKNLGKQLTKLGLSITYTGLSGVDRSIVSLR